MTTNLTKRINESICAVGIPVLRRHRARVTKRPWKRALSSASLCASLTIEAALSLTLFMFTVILLSVPMEILDTQRKVQTVLEVTGRELGWQVYRTSHTVHPAEMEAGKEAEAGEKGTGGWSELPSGLILQGYLKEAGMDWGGRRVFLREKRFRTGGKMGLCGAGQYALPSLAFVPLYIESDHRGCVCRCNFGGA